MTNFTCTALTFDASVVDGSQVKPVDAFPAVGRVALETVGEGVGTSVAPVILGEHSVLAGQSHHVGIVSVKVQQAVSRGSELVLTHADLATAVEVHQYAIFLLFDAGVAE